MSNGHAIVLYSEEDLLLEISKLIEQGQEKVVLQANSAITMHFWQIGLRINRNILETKRADYGRRIVVTLSRQVSWSHILVLLPLKNAHARLFYAKIIADQGLAVKDLRKLIATKAFERTEISNLQNTCNHPAIHNNFKDPYFLDLLVLRNTYLEKDLE